MAVFAAETASRRCWSSTGSFAATSRWSRWVGSRRLRPSPPRPSSAGDVSHRHPARWCACDAARSALRFLAYIAASAVPSWALAIAAAAALWQDGRSWVLLLMIGAAFGYFLLAYIRIRQRHMALDGLHRFASATRSAHRVGTPGHAALRDLLEMLGARRIVAWSRPTTWCDIYDARRVRRVSSSTHAATGTIRLATSHRPPRSRPGGRASLHARSASPTWTCQRARRSPPAESGQTPRPHRRRGALGDHPGVRRRGPPAARDRGWPPRFGASGTRNSSTSCGQRRRSGPGRPPRRGHRPARTPVVSPRRWSASSRSASQLALLTIRVDSLREVNETLGRRDGRRAAAVQAAARLGPLTEDGLVRQDRRRTSSRSYPWRQRRGRGAGRAGHPGVRGAGPVRGRRPRHHHRHRHRARPRPRA